MNILGIRVAPKLIDYSIIKNNDEFFLDKLFVPINLETPRKLSYIRSNLISIIKENEISSIGLRVTEPIAKNVSIERLNIEGVVQELMCDCNLSEYKTFIKSQIKKSLKIDNDLLKDYCKNKSINSPNGIRLEEWNGFSITQKESLLVALSIRGEHND